MTYYSADFSKKAQLKIQQMAFVLVALMIFFGLVAVIYLSIWSSNLEESAAQRQEEEALQIALALAGSPEFAFTSSSDCSSCVDFEKIVSLDKDIYKTLWNLDYLEVEIVYPVPESGETNKITIIPRPPNLGSTSSVFISLVRRDQSTRDFKYEIGKIIVSGGKSSE
ncbi:hypothetical protein J4402_00130 [Candidatus Pacearchaeota archaeon]|nr:hypothetical protein [Candidatus Pacearchaeota archaeon]